MWLKVHYPYEFYTAQLRKTEPEKWSRLVQDAERHGVRVLGVTPGLSGTDWQIRGADGARVIVAGWGQLKGVGPVTVGRILDLEADRKDAGLPPLSSADDLLMVKGIGPKTLDKFRHQIGDEDPFGLKRTGRVLTEVREDIEFGHIRLPRPNCTSDELYDMPDAAPVRWLGMIKQINYQDYIENQRSRTGQEVDEIIKNMKRRDLVTSCVLRCYDDGDEDVYVRIDRFAYPRFHQMLQSLRPDYHVLYVLGKRSTGGAGFGISVQVRKLAVIDPEDQ